MRKRGKRARPVKQLVFLSAFLVLFGILISSAIGRREFSVPHKFILEILGTAQSAVTSVTRSCSNIWSGYVDLWDVREENLRLQEEINKYQSINIKYREAVATNIRLGKLLELKEILPPPTLSAQIIGRDPSQWFKTITVDRGSSDGITRGMPVVTVEGVVGQILDGGAHYSKVLLANDPNSALDVLIQRTRVQGIIKGEGTSYRLHYVLKNNEVEAGDQIVTSGMGGVFPKGLPVGTVSKVVNNKRGMFLEIDVAPAVTFSRLEHVIIIMKSNQLAE
ncbi:MAG: rod shape-determining protein MreC [Proteobacteria bacterium]|nr:rod shape-determining protein MreC [Pseudomonadota bacterium]MBU1737607.1 rod shape-determining protein MreC [Pseudomonadota bacterium]